MAYEHNYLCPLECLIVILHIISISIKSCARLDQTSSFPCFTTWHTQNLLMSIAIKTLRQHHKQKSEVQGVKRLLPPKLSSPYYFEKKRRRKKERERNKRMREEEKELSKLSLDSPTTLHSFGRVWFSNFQWRGEFSRHLKQTGHGNSS